MASLGQQGPHREALAQKRVYKYIRNRSGEILVVLKVYVLQFLNPASTQIIETGYAL